MLRSAWFVTFLVGIVLWTTGASAQTATDPTVEIAEPPIVAQDKTSPSDKSEAQGRPPNYIAILESIHSAIRDLIVPREEEAARLRREQLELGDLKAQQDMALWANLMFWATAGGVLVTGVGLFFIWRTLDYTRQGAEHAAAMVEEGRKATEAAFKAAEAAVEGNRINREIFVQSERPRLILANFAVPPLILKGGAWKATATFHVQNVGKSPAVGVMAWPRLIALKINGNYTKDLVEFVQEQPYRMKLDNGIIPGQTLKSEVGLSLKQSILDSGIQNGDEYHSLMIIGFIEYEFTFDATRRITPFVLIGIGPVPRSGSEGEQILMKFVKAPSPILPT